MYKPIFFY